MEAAMSLDISSMDHEDRRHHKNEQQQNENEQEQTSFVQTNLVSDGSVPAVTTDSNLINPWGIALSSTSPFWVSDNGTGVATIFDGAGTLVKIGGLPAITIAVPQGQPSPPAGMTSPTGAVFNPTTDFNVSDHGVTAPARFIFATEDGTISGWNPTVNPGSTVLAVDNFNGGNGDVYKGLTIGQTDEGNFLFAANFRAGTVDVFDKDFKPVNSFTDPNLPTGFAPFNVQVLDDHLFVTFALQDEAKHDDVAGAGNGFLDEFDLQGNLLNRVASEGVLNSPWGLAIAPDGFGEFSHDLLVGNFGDGTINVFDPKSDHFLGKLVDASGITIKIQDLWSLVPGNASANTDPHKIYFTAGLQDEQHGLFGSLAAIPENDNSAMSTTGSSMRGSMTGAMTGPMTGSMTDTLTNPMAGSMTGPMTGSHSMHG